MYDTLLSTLTNLCISNARQYSIVKELLPDEFRSRHSDTECPLPNSFDNLVGLGRIELPTSPLSGVRSSHLSYRPGQNLRTTTARENTSFEYSGLRFLVELVGIEPATS